MVNRDSQFFWDGTKAGELRIQRCNACGAKRFPPGPACPACGAYDRGYDVAAGTGTVFSYVVHRHPPVPGKELPIVIALIDLDEGVRMVGEVVDVADDEIEIGMAAAGRLPRDRRRADPAGLEEGDEDPRGRPGHPRVEPADDADHDREHRDRDPGLAGRAPRPRRRPGGRLQGHLHEHPDHQRAGREVRRRLGRPGHRAQGHRDPARRASAPLRHADLQRDRRLGRGRDRDDRRRRAGVARRPRDRDRPGGGW